MAVVKNLMGFKKSDMNYAISSDQTVLDALKLMAEAEIGAVLVMEGSRVIGIFTERDYARKGELAWRNASNTPIREVMTEEMYTVTTNTSVEECMALMMHYGIRHLPIVENGKLLGIISMRDVVATVLDERDSEIKGLENYILASGFAR